MSMGPPAQRPCGTAPQYIASMIPANATSHDLHGLRERRSRQPAVSLALLLCLGLPLALLTACSRPAPDTPAAQAPARASSAAAAVAAPAPTALPEPAAAAATPAAAAAETVTPAADTAPSRAATALPPAVVAFQKQRDACDHLRGEEPYDKQRAAFLKAQLAKTCKGSDKALAALRKRFVKHPQAIAALRDYEDRIE